MQEDAHGDIDTVAAMLEPQISGLRRYAYALLRDRDAADDLVQDTLEHAVAGWPGRRDEGDVRAWLFTIARNLFLRMLQRRSRTSPHAGGEAVEALPDQGAGPDVELGVRDVLTMIGTLPEEQRSVLLLVTVEDLSYAETAAVLGIPVGTVMSRLSRARERMRALLETGTIGMLRRVK